MKFHQLISISLLFFICQSSMSAQEITMFSGFWGTKYYQDDTKVKRKEINNLMQEHQLTNVYWNTSKLRNRLSTLSSIASVGFLVWYSSTVDFGPNPQNKYRPLLFVGSAASFGLTIGLSITANTLRKKAILSYNKVHTDESIILNIGQTNHGAGIVLTF